MGPCTSKSRSLDQWAADEHEHVEGEKKENHGQSIYHQVDNPVSCVVNMSNGICASGWDNGKIKLINWNTRQLVHEWEPHKRSVNKLLYATKTSKLYSCSRDTSIMGHPIAPVDLQAGASPQLYQGHSLTVSALAINGDETWLASGARDTSVVLWDVATSTRLQSIVTSQNIVTCMKWIPHDPHLVAQGGEDLRLRVWDSRTWKIPAQTIEGYVYFPLGIDCSDDGNYLLTSSKGFNAVGCEGRIWDRRTGKQVVEMNGHTQDATACTYISGRNEESITVSKDSSIRVWDTMTGEALASCHDGNAGMFTSVECVHSDNEVVQILTSSFAGRIDLYEWDRKEQHLAMA